MTDTVTVRPSGSVKAASCSRFLGKNGRALSPMRASSPSRVRAPSPIQASSRKDVLVAPAKGHFTDSGCPDGLCTLSPNAGSPSLRRPHGFPSRKSRTVLRAPMRTSLKFPGPTEEERDIDRPVATLTPRESEEDSPVQEGSDAALAPRLQTQSSLDRIELQAKQSLTKLKHLLYKLKTRRDGEVTSTLVTTPSSSEPTVVEDEQQVFVSQKIEVDLSKSGDGETFTEAANKELIAKAVADVQMIPKVPGADLNLASLRNGLEIQLDALTATRAVVTFDDATQTAVVTVTATVRAAELDDKGSYAEKAIAMAAKALARTCLELDEKAQASALASVSSPREEAKVISAPAAGSAHQKIHRDLLAGTVISWQLATPEFGCTPLRPVYCVRLELVDGSFLEALFKPCVPGDRLLRWKRAPEDWVAFQLSSLLGMDVVPPAAVRSRLKLGDRVFDLGVLVLKPGDLSRLEDTNPSLAPSNPQTIVSDIRILDTLLGNALRPRNSFLAVSGHWSSASGSAPEDGERVSPLILSQPMGPRLGRGVHSMWSPTGSTPSRTPAVQVVSQKTFANLKGLSRASLADVFGGALSLEEMEDFLAKRDHLLAYFEGLGRRLGWANVCI